MAKNKKMLTYSKMVKKALAKAKRQANPAAAKLAKKKNLESKAKSMSNKMTAPEKIFSDMMKELGIKCDAQKVIGNKIFDFYIPSKNLIIEIHGDYWHANPLIYEGKELNKTQARNVKNDKYKTILAKGSGYSFYVLWEYDLNNNYEEKKEEFIRLWK